MNYTIASAILNGRSSKKIATQTFLHSTIAGVKIRYYDLDIIYFKKNGDILVNTDNTRLKTIKDRLNTFLPLRHQGIYSRRGIWFWKNGTPFKDRTVIRDDNNICRVLQRSTEF